VELCTHQLLHDHYLLLPGRLPLSEKEVDLNWANPISGVESTLQRYKDPLAPPPPPVLTRGRSACSTGP
jgi:hypothetical protein